MTKWKEIPSIDLDEERGSSFHIHQFVSFDYDPADSPNPETPHRHNFQELIWIKSGRGEQTIDGETSEITPATFYLIAKGQVHHFLKAEKVDGFVLRFSEDFCPEPGENRHRRFLESFFNNVRTLKTLSVDGERVTEFDRLLSIIFREFEAPHRFGKFAILRNLLQALLIKIVQNLDDNDAEVGSLNRVRDNIFIEFLALLEENFKAHHDVAFYTDALTVTARQLSDRTHRAIGKTTKQIIEERIALEAKRAFRFTEKPVKEVAYDLGYEDPSYFSKVFKKVTGRTPQEYQGL